MAKATTKRNTRGPIDLFDILKAWVKENYPNLSVTRLGGDYTSLEAQVRINYGHDVFAPFQVQKPDSLIAIYINQPKTVYVLAPTSEPFWEVIEIDLCRLDYFDLMGAAITKALANRELRHVEPA